MAEELEIIPVLVVAASQNQAEMLNSLLRSHGVAAHASWTNQLEGWDEHTPAPEIVLFVADSSKLTLEDVVSQAAPRGTPVIVVAREHPPNEAARAIEGGAADWVSSEDGALLAAVVRRERKRGQGLRHALELEQAVEHQRARLTSLISGSQEAIAHLQDGVIVEANPAWAERFGYATVDEALGLPVMDLFPEPIRPQLKEALKKAARGHPQASKLAVGIPMEGRRELPVTVEISCVPAGQQSQIQMAIRGKGAPTELELQIEELEQEKSRLVAEIQALDQREKGVNILWPTTFAPIAAERLNRPLAGFIRALVAFRPADLAEASRLLGPLGIAEAGGDVSSTLSPLLAEEDLATRLDNLCALVLVNRKNEASLSSWIESVLRALGSHIFEAGSRSTHIGFVAGYAAADRVRQLEAVVRQSLQAAQGTEGSVHRASPETHRHPADVTKLSWQEVIPEALQERRFAIALKPIEELARGSKLYEAIPRLLDRAGNEIDAEAFYRPAQRLGLLDGLERRLLGYAFIAQLRLQHARESTRMLIPLSAGALDDASLPALLRSLGSHPSARATLKSLVIEMDQHDIAGRIRDVEKMSREFGKLGCGLGIRGFTATRAAEQLLDDLQFATLRFSPKLFERLESDDALQKRARAISDRCAKSRVLAIASEVPDANAMAMLYNLGVGVVEGPVIGEPVLFSPAAAEEEPLLKELEPN